MNRLVSDLDAEIAATRERLTALITARRALTGTTRRPPSNQPQEPSPTQNKGPTILQLLSRIMADGTPRSIETATRALNESGTPVNRASVNAALHRGSKGAQPVFVRTSPGTYQLLKEVRRANSH